MGFRIALGTLNFILGKAAGALDGNFLLLAGALVLSGYMQNAVGVNVKGHFNLRHAARSGGNAVQLEVAEELVILKHLAFALANADIHGGLVISGGGEHLALAHRNGRVAFDHRSGDAAHRFNGQGQRSHVQQKHVIHVPLKHAALNSGAQGHHFIRVHALVGFLAGQRMGHFLHGGHTGHAAHQHQLVNVSGFQPGRGNAVQHRLAGAVQQVFRELFQLGTAQRQLDMLGAGSVRRDERQADVIALGGGKGDLGLFRFFLDALNGVRLVGKIHAGVFLELAYNPVDDCVVPVIAAQVGVTVGSLHLKHSVADFQHGNIKGAAAEVIYGNVFIGLFVQAVGQGRRRRFIDNAAHFKACDFTGGLGRVALGVIEIGGDGNHGLRNRFAKFGFRIGFQLGQHHGSDFLGGKGLLFTAHIHADVGISVGSFHNFVRHLFIFFRQFTVLTADEALGGKHGVFRVGYRLTFGGLPHEAFTAFGESNNGGSGARTFAVFKYGTLTAFHHSHARVGRAKVDS